MEKVLRDKVIVISGGTKGVGRTIAEECGIRGAKVVIGGRDEESAKKSLRLIRSYGSDGMFVYTELTKVEDIRNLFSSAYEKYGGGLFMAGETEDKIEIENMINDLVERARKASEEFKKLPTI